MSEALINAVEAIATLSAELSSSSTELHVSAAAPEELRGHHFRIRVGREVMLVTATAGSGASPWTVIRNAENVFDGSGAVNHIIGEKVYHGLTAAGAAEIRTEAEEACVKLVEKAANGGVPTIEEALTIKGTPASGKVLVAISGTEAEWQTRARVHMRQSPTWAIPAEATAPTFMPGPTIWFAAGEEVKIVRCDFRIYSGTKAKFKILKNGSVLSGFGSSGVMEAKNEAGDSVLGEALGISSGDVFTLEITEVAGLPTGFAATLTLERIAS